MVLLLDEARHRRHMAERALQHAAVEDPFLKLISEDIGRKKPRDMVPADGRKPRDHQPVIGDLKTERLQAQMLHAPRDEHAERLVRLAAGEGVEQCMVTALEEMLDQQPVRAGDGGKTRLQIEPIAHIRRQRAPFFWLGQ